MTYTKRTTWIAAVAVVTAGLGCGGDAATTPPSAVRENQATPLAEVASVQPQPQQQERPQRQQQSSSPRAQSQQPQPQTEAARPVAIAKKPGAAQAAQIPSDARYTILCSEFSGPSHVQEAMLAKNNFVQATGRGDFHVVHVDGQGSQLYFGYYRTNEPRIDEAEAKRIAADRNWLRTLTTHTGQQIFRNTAVVPLPLADPDAPPEYDITRLDADKSPDDETRAYWTIGIAAYTADARGEGADAGKNRKQLAVEAVMLAREKYKVPAYYHHGENVSTVCVGAWPRHAVREQETNKAETTGDVNQSLVVSPAPLPSRLTDQLQASGKNVKVLQPKIEIVDPTMLETWKRFPEYAVDGQVQVNTIADPATGKRTARPQSSFLVEIPRTQPTLLRDNTPAQDTSPNLLTPMTPRQNDGGGRLRSVGK